MDVIGNDISLNRDGLSLYTSYVNPTDFKINENIIDNYKFNMYTMSEGPAGYVVEINAIRNWWGSSNPDDFTSKNYEGVYWSSASAVLKIFPFLDAPKGNEVQGNYLNGVLESDFTIDVGDDYTVLGMLWVTADSSLTVNPGATVNFTASSTIVAKGELYSEGTAESHIVLTGSVIDDAKVVHENARIIVLNNNSTIRYTDFNNFSHGVYLYENKIDIRDCLFSNFVRTAIRYKNTQSGLVDKNVVIENNLIENSSRFGTGLIIESAYQSNWQINNNIFKTLVNAVELNALGDSTTKFIQNEVYDSTLGVKTKRNSTGVILNDNKIYNNDVGVFIDGATPQYGRILPYESDISVKNNQIYNNLLYNLSSPEVVDARYNWWGTIVELEIVKKLDGTIIYSPYLDGPQGALIYATKPYHYLEDDLRLEKNSDYTLPGSLYIPAGRTLTIESGVTLRMPDYSSLYVAGNIIIHGTKDNPVQIIPENLTPFRGIWKGIVIETDSVEFNEFKYVDIQYAKYAIYANSGKIFVGNCSLSNSYVSGIRYGSNPFLTPVVPPEVIVVNSDIYNSGSHGINLSRVDKYYVAGNYIHDNESNGISISHVTSSYVNNITSKPIPHIRSNRIVNSQNYSGIFLEGDNASGVTDNILSGNPTGILLWFSSKNYLPIVTNNDLSGNLDASLRLYVSSSIITQLDVGSNWWGTIDTTEIDALITDGIDKASLAIASYLPILATSKILQTPVFDDYLVDSNALQFDLSGNAGPNVNINIYNQSEVLLASVISSPEGRFSTPVPLVEGDNIYYARAENGGVLTDYSLPVTISRDTTAPVITIDTPVNDSVTSAPLITFTGTLSEKSFLTINGIPISIGPEYQFNHEAVSLQEGLNSFTIEAVDDAGNSSTEIVTITLDTTPPSQVDQGSVTVGEVIVDSTTISGGVGSAEAGSTVQIINSRTGETVQTIVNADGSFSIQIGAQAGDILLMMVIDTVGNTSVWNNKKVAGIPPSNAITITAPLDGAIVLQDFINVRGTFTAPAYSKITVNGKPAMTSGDRFYINNVGLNSGVNIVEVKIEAADGQILTQAFTVTNNSYLDSSFNNFYVGVAPANGMVPLATKYQIILNTTDPITQITVDFDGDGDIDLTTTDVDLLEYTYTQPGEYTASIQIQTATSNETHQQYVVVYGSQQLGAYLRGIYYTMLDQLSLGNIANGMYFLTPTMQDKYQTAFTNLGSQLQTIIPGLGNIVGGSIYGDVAELVITRDEAEQTKAFPLTMLRGNDGRWRISDM